jgi:hypothetical protein
MSTEAPSTSTKLLIDLKEMHEELRREAFETRVSMAEIVRQALAIRARFRRDGRLDEVLQWANRDESARGAGKEH